MTKRQPPVKKRQLALRLCMRRGVPFHFKQWGGTPDHGINLPERPALRQRRAADGTMMVRVGKKSAGRNLDGVAWDGLPVARES